MSDFLSKIVVGNAVLYPAVLRGCLRKWDYLMIYVPETETLTLEVKRGGAAEVFLELRCVSYESASKLAEELGLKGDGERSLIWSKCNPLLTLHHDESDEAEALRMEMLRLGVPHVVYHNAQTIGLVDDLNLLHRCEPPTNSIDPPMLGIIREVAKRHKEQLETTP